PAAVGAVTVQVDSVRATAEAGGDFNLTLPVSVVFTAAQTSATFNVAIHPDAVYEPTEYVEFYLQWISDGALPGLRNRHGLLIEDNAVNGDNDCMPDWWEFKYFGDTNVSAGGTNDYDGDTITDCDEFLLGTDPTLPYKPDTNGVLKLNVLTPLLEP
ncbi:MAG: Calx-beta domain-containing protein, partial [Verrucomicrobiota bacterium]